MKVIIPMTGNGARFKSAGYSKLKPFIKINGRPMIFWVTQLFKDFEIILVLRKNHWKELAYVRRDLKLYCPQVKIVLLDKWKKLGPANDVIEASDAIEDLNEEVIVAYCDFHAIWNIKKFLRIIRKNKADGAIPCYTGFHPHLLYPENLYASCKSTKDYQLIEIREKHQFSKKKCDDLISPGIYYFKSFQIMKNYCKILIDSNQSINGEYYCSLPFNFMKQDGLKILTPPIVSHFCQWGTPYDLEDFNFWTKETFLAND